MRRKLVKQGRNALTVTVPASWAKKFNLKAGDEVEVEEIKEKVVLSTEKIKDIGKKTIDVSGLSPMIKRILGAIYKAGYDEVEVRFESSEELKTIQEVVREEFIGFEITSHGKNNLIFKKVSAINPEEFGTMMRRMFLIIKSMGDDCVEATKNKDYDFLKAIVLRDKDINKIADFCRRSLNSCSHLIDGRVAPIYFIAEQLEKIGDHYRDMCKILLNNNIKSNKEIIDILSQVNSFFEDFYSLYFEFNTKDMAEFGKKRYDLIEKIDKLVGTASKEEMPMIFSIRQIVDSTFDNNGPLMSARL